MRAERDQGLVEKLSILRSSAMFQCQGGRARSAICLASASSFAPSACPITTIGAHHKPLMMHADFDVGRSAISACHPSLIARHSSLPFAWSR